MLKVGEMKENSVKLSYYYERNLVNKKEKKLSSLNRWLNSSRLHGLIFN